jgi:hypothetical protein
MDTELLDAVEEIRAIVKVLASERVEALLDAVAGKSANRKAMFKAFNGKLTLTEIASRTGTTKQAVQKFADECESKGLIRFVPGSNGIKRAKRIF